MKYYVIEELTKAHTNAIAKRLEEMELGAGMEGLYWLPVPKAHLSNIQVEHTDECGPHAMGLELEGDSLKLELLVRARNRLRCDCVTYASPELKLHMISYLDAMLDELEIYV